MRVVVHSSLSPDIALRLQKFAADERMTISSAVEFLVSEALKQRSDKESGGNHEKK